jgi:hypothetical protein
MDRADLPFQRRFMNATNIPILAGLTNAQDVKMTAVEKQVVPAFLYM